MINNKLCGERIKTLRKENKLSQDDLAIKCNVIRQTLAKWEKGELNLTLDDAIHLCNVLDCDIGYLIGEYNCRKHVTADVKKSLNFEENAINNIINLGKYCGEQSQDTSKIIDFIAIINKLFSTQQLPLMKNLYDYINYKVNPKMVLRINETNNVSELYSTPKQNNLFGNPNPETIPVNFLEEIHLKNVISDIENLKKVLVEENDKMIADRELEELKREEQEQKSRRKLF